MAHTWADGEIITAEKLNTLEGRIGFDVVEGVVLTEETVTTTNNSGFNIGTLAYSNFIKSDVLNITFDGIEYSLEKRTQGDGSNIYGDLNEETMPVFNTYPFALNSNSYYGNQIVTETSGNHSIKITANTSIKTTSTFEQAVKKFGLNNIKDGERIGAIIEGSNTTASGDYSHAEGNRTNASGQTSHAEGSSTTASGNFSHAEGESTTASGIDSHAEGGNTTASGLGSHAEGGMTTASGNNSHAQNNNTIAQGQSQTAIGEYNIAQGTTTSKSNTDYAFIIGNGTSNSRRSNAFAIKWDGTFVFANGTEITPAQFASLLNSLSGDTAQ